MRVIKATAKTSTLVGAGWVLFVLWMVEEHSKELVSEGGAPFSVLERVRVFLLLANPATLVQMIQCRIATRP